MLNVIGRRKFYLSLSIALVVAAFVIVAVFGFREGIDFRGGTLWQFKAGGTSPARLAVIFKDELKVENAHIVAGPNDEYLARMQEITEEEHVRLRDTLRRRVQSFEELSFASVGPSIGKALRRRSLIAIALVLVGISLYIAFAFRKVYRPVSSWKYGWVTLATLLHDVAIPAGMLAVLGRYAGVEIDANFVVALLVVMGFSVHDTIVVFDRIRENLLLDRGRSDFGQVINNSVSQTLMRSLNTSLTLVLVLIALLVAGPMNLQYFVLTLLVGVVTGIYSSIFVASPILYIWHKFSAPAFGK